MQCDLKWNQKSSMHEVIWNYSLFTYCQLIRHNSTYLCIIIAFIVFFSSPFLSIPSALRTLMIFKQTDAVSGGGADFQRRTKFSDKVPFNIES